MIEMVHTLYVIRAPSNWLGNGFADGRAQLVGCWSGRDCVDGWKWKTLVTNVFSNYFHEMIKYVHEKNAWSGLPWF